MVITNTPDLEMTNWVSPCLEASTEEAADGRVFGNSFEACVRSCRLFSAAEWFAPLTAYLKFHLASGQPTASAQLDGSETLHRAEATWR